MVASYRPHVLGIDDGPFDKALDERVPVVGVMMEGGDLVEAVAVSDLPLDCDAPGDLLAGWVSGLRFASALHAVVLGGVTIAGLGVVDIESMARRVGKPVMLVNRQRPEDGPLNRALDAAGVGARKRIVARMPAAWRLDDGLFVAHAGASRSDAERILRATRTKSHLPEPLRVAHLVASALVRGQSHGRP